ncbi:uncharacterized protein K489DRAFT_377241 [Dissoconium aciculare CBS 342.82]|uniref:Uncharacterized protein n=1 Tax=Dissoconium aciculare CBS 342.82 TaxID=1314786 RepID=A0A6J3MIQ4_9PEZI|nr:uncharacterized protein K489DRAFT_377241 [Dissoconium aciculare CBS 342.82]KAF1826792.1 hypothetical protein K489DRAFT_377241 [Dissoconium aciculare CBS 342.82]
MGNDLFLEGDEGIQDERPECKSDDSLMSYLPTFKVLPTEHDLDLRYYESSNGYSYQPRRHWCFLAQITDVNAFMRVGLSVKDQEGVEIPVWFYTEDRGFDYLSSSVREGQTIAILYAERHAFMFDSIGVRVELRDTVKVEHQSGFFCSVAMN